MKYKPGRKLAPGGIAANRELQYISGARVHKDLRATDEVEGTRSTVNKKGYTQARKNVDREE